MLSYAVVLAGVISGLHKQEIFSNVVYAGNELVVSAHYSLWLRSKLQVCTGTPNPPNPYQILLLNSQGDAHRAVVFAEMPNLHAFGRSAARPAYHMQGNRYFLRALSPVHHYICNIMYLAA